VTTLVLVHGCGTDAHFWDHLRAHVGDLDILAPSLPGRAATGGEAPTTAAAAARWILQELRARKIARPIVVGHSYGGAIAIEVALADPDALAGLVLVCTGARLRVLPAILEATLAAIETGIPIDLERYTYRPQSDPVLVEQVESLARRTPVAATARGWAATDAFDRLRDVASIRVPTLVVAGTADPLTPPKYAQYLAQKIAGAELEIVQDGGHMLPVEHAAVLGPRLVAFASSLK
jgi:pimeloyl-ACP methyl ester carboxylesterase